VLHLCRALLHGKEPFAVKKGRRVNGEEENHDKTKKKPHVKETPHVKSPETTHGKEKWHGKDQKQHTAKIR
jgi:hypothetical protein